MDFVWKPPGGRRTLSTQQSRYESKTPHIGALGSKVTNLSPRGTSDSVHSTISMWILNSYNAISSPVTGHNLSQLFFGPPQPIVFLTPHFVYSLTNIFFVTFNKSDVRCCETSYKDHSSNQIEFEDQPVVKLDIGRLSYIIATSPLDHKLI